MPIIKSALYLGVHKLVKRDNDDITINIGYRSPQPQEESVKICVNTITSKTPITHELHLSGNTLHNSSQHIIVPNQDICIMAFLSSGSDINRPRDSKVILYEDNLYYCLTWTDVIGNTKHNKACGLKRQKDGRYITYLQIAPLDHYEKVNKSLIEQHPGLYVIK